MTDSFAKPPVPFATTETVPHADNENGERTTTPARPYTRSQASALRPARTASATCTGSRNDKKTRRKKRTLEFTIFCDPIAVADPIRPAPKRSKIVPRLPLVDRSDSSNSTPVTSPRTSNTPFPFSTADPFWEDVENYDARAYATPPTTPVAPWPVPSSGIEPGSLRRSGRTSRARREARSVRLARPADMEAYHVLGISDWRVSESEIRLAYRKVAFTSHPDRVADGEREAATRRMQQVNAARELLLDDQRRRQYHADGAVSRLF